MKIYTKTGDDGTTFHDGNRVAKYSCAVDGQGEIDELNCWIGMIRDRYKKTVFLEKIQKDLFEIGAQLATNKKRIKQEDIDEIEKNIDEINCKLPELKNFILPFSVSEIHVARAVCRRAERVVSLWRDKEIVDSDIKEFNRFDLVIPYINRLSDFLFVFARLQVETKKNLQETVWKGE